MKRFITALVAALLLMSLYLPAGAENACFDFGRLRLNMPAGVEKQSYSDQIFTDTRSGADLQITTRHYDQLAGLGAAIGLKMGLNDPDVASRVAVNRNGVAFTWMTADYQGLSMPVLFLFYDGDLVAVFGTGSGLDATFDYISANAEVLDAPAAVDATVSPTADGYLLHNGPLTVAVSDAEWNVLYCGMPADAKSLARLDISAATADSLVKQKFAELLVLPPDWPDNDMQFFVKLKDKKYADEPAFMQDAVLRSTAEGLSGGEYTTEVIGGVTYYVYEVHLTAGTDYQLRYATIVDGDMLYYILAKSTPITQADRATLRHLMEGVTYGN